MGATVRTTTAVDTNVVDPAIALKLLVPMTYGEISLSARFEQHPGGTLSYKGIHQDDISEFEQKYRVGRTLTINNLYLMVESYGYTRERFVHGSAPNEITLDTYEVTISLTGGNAKKEQGLVETTRLISRKTGKVSVSQIARAAGISCSSNLKYYETSPTNTFGTVIQSNVRRDGYVDYCGRSVRVRSINSGNFWRFGAGEVKTDGENTRGEIPYYKQAVLQDTWSDLPDEEALEREEPDFEREEIEKEELIEEDENPDLPPPGTTVLRTLDSNFDKGGPKRTRKKVYYENGVKVREELWIWGFMYTAEQISVLVNGEPTGLLFSDRPADFWQVVEYTDTPVTYEKAPPTRASVRAWDDFGKPIKVIVHPDYQQFVSGSSNFTFSTTQELLVEENAKGWRWTRFKEESEAMETLNPEDPFYEAYQFIKLPKVAQRSWQVRPSREIFIAGDEAQPFRLEFMALGEMPPALQRLAGGDPDEEPEKLVGVLYPETNFNEQFWVERHTEYSNSFRAIPHPEDSEDNPQPPLVTGQEALKSESNTGYDKDQKTQLFKKYRKRTVSYSSQDAGFERSALQIRSQEFEGAPSSPSSRNNAWKEKESANQQANQSSKPAAQYLITSNLAGKLLTGGVSVENATSLTEAKKALRNQLIIDTANAVTASKTVMWWLPRIRPWDVISISPERFRGGSWRVLDVSWNIKVDPPNEYTNGQPFCTIDDGTQLSLGMFINRSISAKKELIDDGEEPPTEERGFKATVTTNSRTIGGIVDILENRENRRKFNV